MKQPTTLVIHPQDSTTVFLETIYRDVPNKTVVTSGVKKKELLLMAEGFDRIMMMGHGFPWGLSSVDVFRCLSHTIVDKSWVPLLTRKKDPLFIWCHADQFVMYHELKGFYTGMFISEQEEAEYCGLQGISQEAVDESNDAFSSILAKYIHLDSKTIFKNVRKEYGKFAAKNPVADFNVKRLFCA